MSLDLGFTKGYSPDLSDKYSDLAYLEGMFTPILQPDIFISEFNNELPFLKHMVKNLVVLGAGPSSRLEVLMHGLDMKHNMDIPIIISGSASNVKEEYKESDIKIENNNIIGVVDFHEPLITDLNDLMDNIQTIDHELLKSIEHNKKNNYIPILPFKNNKRNNKRNNTKNKKRK